MSNAAISSVQLKYNNNLSLIDTLCVNDYFSYLTGFKSVLEKINKINVLKSSNYNINLPTITEINALMQYYKKNDTNNITSLLMTFIVKTDDFLKRVNGSGRYMVIELNNGSKCYIRLLSFEKKITSIITSKNITDIKSIYNEYIKEYPYINEYFISMGMNNSNNLYEVFGDLLHINKNINILCHNHSNVYYISINSYNIIRLDKRGFDINLNKGNAEQNIDDSTNDSNVLNIKERLKIFNSFLSNIKSNSNPNKYIEIALEQLKRHSENNMISNMYDNSKLLLKQQKVDDILFNKLSPIVTFIIMLQPYSICDLQYLLFNISDEFVLPKRVRQCGDNYSIVSSASNIDSQSDIKCENSTMSNTLLNKIESNTNNTCFSAQKIILNMSNYVLNNNKDEIKYDINDLIKTYTEYFDNDENLTYKVVWLVIVSYYLESIIYDCKGNYKNLHYDNIITYTKLYGIKQYTKGNFYKKRIEWIFKLYDDDTNSHLLLPNLFKYCNWIIMDKDKSEFLFNLCNEEDLDSETTEIDEIEISKNT
jgi:hypothetical protein